MDPKQELRLRDVAFGLPGLIALSGDRKRRAAAAQAQRAKEAAEQLAQRDAVLPTDRPPHPRPIGRRVPEGGYRWTCLSTDTRSREVINVHLPPRDGLAAWALTPRLTQGGGLAFISRGRRDGDSRNASIQFGVGGEDDLFSQPLPNGQNWASRLDPLPASRVAPWLPTFALGPTWAPRAVRREPWREPGAGRSASRNWVRVDQQDRVWNRVHVGNCFTDPAGDSYVLLFDADGKPRGWLKVDQLADALAPGGGDPRTAEYWVNGGRLNPQKFRPGGILISGREAAPDVVEPPRGTVGGVVRGTDMQEVGNPNNPNARRYNVTNPRPFDQPAALGGLIASFRSATTATVAVRPVDDNDLCVYQEFPAGREPATESPMWLLNSRGNPSNPPRPLVGFGPVAANLLTMELDEVTSGNGTYITPTLTARIASADPDITATVGAVMTPMTDRSRFPRMELRKTYTPGAGEQKFRFGPQASPTIYDKMYPVGTMKTPGTRETGPLWYVLFAVNTSTGLKPCGWTRIPADESGVPRLDQVLKLQWVVLRRSPGVPDFAWFCPLDNSGRYLRTDAAGPMNRRFNPPQEVVQLARALPTPQRTL